MIKSYAASYAFCASEHRHGITGRGRDVSGAGNKDFELAERLDALGRKLRTLQIAVNLQLN